MRRSLQGRGGMQVPCGTCTGCCTSGYSVQLRPVDHRAAARIPPELLESAAGFPADQRTMWPRANGTCPMLEAGRCTIYEVRPQTCLDYDCRVFAAAGIEAGGQDKAVINERVRSWRFGYPTSRDELAHRAVQTAAAFIRERRESFEVPVPAGPMGIAVLAIKACEVFMPGGSPEGAAEGVVAGRRADAAIAAAIVRAARRFDEAAAAPDF